MMGRQADQSAFLYDFALDRHVPVDHMLRSVDRFVELDEIRVRLAPFYSHTGRPSIDPDLLIRMLVTFQHGKAQCRIEPLNAAGKVVFRDCWPLF